MVVNVYRFGCILIFKNKVKEIECNIFFNSIQNEDHWEPYHRQSLGISQLCHEPGTGGYPEGISGPLPRIQIFHKHSYAKSWSFHKTVRCSWLQSRHHPKKNWPGVDFINIFAQIFGSSLLPRIQESQKPLPQISFNIEKINNGDVEKKQR